MDLTSKTAITAEFIRSELSADARPRCWDRQQVPVKAFENAQRSWVPSISRDDVIFFWDISNSMSGKYGLLVTDTHVYVRYKTSTRNNGLLINDVVRLDDIWTTGCEIEAAQPLLEPEAHFLTLNNLRFFRPLTPESGGFSKREKTGEMTEKVARLIARFAGPRSLSQKPTSMIDGLTDESFQQVLADCEASGRIPVVEFPWNGSYDREFLALFGYYRYGSRFVLCKTDASKCIRIDESIEIRTRPLLCFYRHGKTIRVIRSHAYTYPDHNRRYIGTEQSSFEGIITAYGHASDEASLRAISDRLSDQNTQSQSKSSLLHSLGEMMGKTVSQVTALVFLVIMVFLIRSCTSH